MKIIFLKSLAVALLTIGIFLHGSFVWAKSPTKENKKAVVKEQSISGPMNNIKAGETGPAKGTAGKASIAINLSEDKTSIPKITVSIDKISYEIKASGWTKNGNMTGVQFFINGPFPINNKTFETKAGKGTTSIKGGFNSPEEAQGSAHLYHTAYIEGNSYVIDLGEWEWKAAAK